MPGRTTRNIHKRKHFEIDTSFSGLSSLRSVTDGSDTITNEPTTNAESNETTLEDFFGRKMGSSTIVLGDFNLHHPAWGGDDALTDTANLDLWLAPGTITRDESGHKTTIDTLTTADGQPRRRNWKAMETEKFDKFVASNLPGHDEGDWEEYKPARNQKGRMIKEALRKGFREFVKEAIGQGPQGLWRMAKWARNRGQEQGHTMPPLNTADAVAESTDEKVQALRRAVFPAPPTADLLDIENSTRNRQQITFPSITKQELADAIRRAPLNKARGRRRPKHVTLRKAGPRDYRLPKAYRPVALLNTLGKVLEAIIATRIAWAVEEHRLLPDTHLGGRKGVSVDHAIQLILAEFMLLGGRAKRQACSCSTLPAPTTTFHMKDFFTIYVKWGSESWHHGCKLF
ncbi:hypothetical protein PENARI_c017G00750 [Penicillium arizonense]|uniref:Endonuclease/exonuclease/phosphatase domain-containing protein n=1 Tax=Penicillium arizonense TaxID=1835702 RepID=A0A1F5LB40_PENAI|nr:hypothetical protein PENARI_c017G00750 [Penicillium arizonense]OGE50276.1 hypothetical protein PENARI_c017G00750 [Penicillium arizonense]